VLVFAVAGIDGTFDDRQTFRWDHPPPAAIKNAGSNGVELFVRARADRDYAYVGRRAHVSMYSAAEARFTLREVLPIDLAAHFGSPPPQPRDPLLGPALAAALATPEADRWALARRLHESWFGPLAFGAVEDGPAPDGVRRWHAIWEAIHREHRGALACQQGGTWEEHDGGAGVSGWTDASPEELAPRLARGATRLALPEWAWPAEGSRLFYTERAYVAAARLSSDHEQLQVVAPSDDDFERTRRELDVATDRAWDIHYH
jgi:hypothetical protein